MTSEERAYEEMLAWLEHLEQDAKPDPRPDDFSDVPPLPSSESPSSPEEREKSAPPFVWGLYSNG